MFFKKTILIIAALTMLLGLSACSEFMNEKANSEQVIELNDERLRCLKTLPELIRQFIDGVSEEEDIRASGACLRDAFAYFRKRTRGSVENGYSTQDLRNFFGKYFLKENNISVELGTNLMKMKKALLGGSADSLSKSELDRVIEILKIIEDEAVNLSPAVKVILTTEKSGVSSEEIVEAEEAMRGSAHRLLEKVDLSRSDYSFADGKELLSSVADFARSGKEVATFEQIKKWMPFLDSVKKVFFSEGVQLQGKKEWTDAVDTVVDLYGSVLRYHYLLRGSHFTSSKEINDALTFAERILNLIEASPQMKKTGKIPFATIDALIDQAYEQHLLKIDVPADALKDLYQRVIIAMLDPQRRGDSRGAVAFESIHLSVLRRELMIFRLNQNWINATVEGRVLSSEEMRGSLEGFNVDKEAGQLVPAGLEKEALRRAWDGFKNLLNRNRPINFNQNGRVLITSSPERNEWTWASLTQFNAMHSLVRGFMAGYGDETDPLIAGCSEAKLIKWYADFTKFGIAMKAFDPRSGNSGPRSFKEARFFTYSSSGDDRIDMAEMFEFTSLLFAGGLGNVQSLREILRDEKCELPKTSDVFGNPYVDELCFRRVLRAKFSTLFDNLPGLTQMVSRMDDSAWNLYLNDVFSASRRKDAQAGRVETSEIRTAVMLLHYSESLFVVFDKDRNDRLSRPELQEASKRFMSIIKPMSPIEDEDFVAEAFVAMVFSGQKPDGWSMLSYGWEQFLSSVGITDHIEATRADVARVFKSLAAEMSKPAAK